MRQKKECAFLFAQRPTGDLYTGMHCKCTVSSSSFCKLTLHLFHLIAAFSDFRRYRHAASSPHSSLYINITRTRSSFLRCSHQKREVVAGVLYESTHLFFLTRTRDQQINKRYTKCLFSVARFPLFLFSFLLLYCVLLIACACFSTVHAYSYCFSSFHFFLFLLRCVFTQKSKGLV